MGQQRMEWAKAAVEARRAAGVQGRLEALDGGLAAELRGEQATSLSRAGRRLAVACDVLAEHRERLLREPRPIPRLLLADYLEALKQARVLKWELRVQREAMGLRHHHDLDAAYPLPRLGEGLQILEGDSG